MKMGLVNVWVNEFERIQSWVFLRTNIVKGIGNPVEREEENIVEQEEENSSFPRIFGDVPLVSTG